MERKVNAAHPALLALSCAARRFKEARARADPTVDSEMTLVLKGVLMTRNQLVKQLADIATRPIGPAPAADAASEHAAQIDATYVPPTELFVWFEDTAARALGGRKGIAGLPESLLPINRKMQVAERRYAEDHLHLLTAIRIKCRENASELIASLYTAALSVGTVAWIGTGTQYARTWNDMYSTASNAK
jgi:hypothetical protein